MKSILLILVACLISTACSVSAEKPSTDIIDQAVKDYGGVAYYFNSKFALPVKGYEEKNHYTRKIGEETWLVYDYEVTRKVVRGSLQAAIPEKIMLTVGFTKRGDNWYSIKM